MYSTSDISQTHTNIIIIHIKLKFENFIICKLIIYFFPHMRKHFTLYIRIRQKYILKQKYNQSTNTCRLQCIYWCFLNVDCHLKCKLKMNDHIHKTLNTIIQTVLIYYFLVIQSVKEWGNVLQNTKSHLWF